MDANERMRLERLTEHERRLGASYRWVAGIDEAGRGCLAGPVICAAVIPGGGEPVAGVDDSKKVTPRRREELYDRIRATAAGVGVGSASPREIDLLNIYRATQLAMLRAVRALPVAPGYLLVDGMPLDGPVPAEKVVGGDGRCYAIAAASIIAKVTRDRLMRRLDAVFPQFGFARHKGYGTRVHLEALRLHRPCILHRKTFAPVAARL